MTPRTQSRKKDGTFSWFTPTQKKENTIIRIRGIGWFSLLKLLLIGYAFGSLPFIALLNYAAISAPTALSEEVKSAISLPAVLWVWPLAVLVAAWFTNLFVGFGLRVFGAFWSLRIAVLVDEKTVHNPES